MSSLKGVEASSNLSSAERFLRSALVDQNTTDAIAHLAPEVRYHVHGHNAFTGDFHGPEAVVNHLQKMYQATGGDMAIVKYDDWLTSEDRVLAIVRHQFQLSGRWVQARRLALFEFTWAHAIREIHVFSEDEEALDAAVGPYVDQG
jgi:hypothetical protein